MTAAKSAQQPEFRVISPFSLALARFASTTSINQENNDCKTQVLSQHLANKILGLTLFAVRDILGCVCTVQSPQVLILNYNLTDINPLEGLWTTHSLQKSLESEGCCKAKTASQSPCLCVRLHVPNRHDGIAKPVSSALWAEHVSSGYFGPADPRPLLRNTMFCMAPRLLPMQWYLLIPWIRGWHVEEWTSSDDRVRGGKSQVWQTACPHSHARTFAVPIAFATYCDQSFLASECEAERALGACPPKLVRITSPSPT